MSFIRKTLKAYFLTIILIICCFQSSLNIKIKSELKENNDYYQKMKKFFEIGLDKTKLNQPNPKKCWDYIWASGVEQDMSLKATVKQIKDGDIKTFLSKPNSTKIDVVKDLKSFISSLSSTTRVGGDTIDCKTDLQNIVISVTKTMSSLVNKMKEIFDVSPSPSGPKSFVTSSASVHRDLSIRNPDLFKILNAN